MRLIEHLRGPRAAATTIAPAPTDDLAYLQRRWHEPGETLGTRGDEARATLAAMHERPEAKRDLPVDLRGLRLLDAELGGLDLGGCDLSFAELSRADLTGANLFRAKLVGATLYQAKLSGAELSGADLSGANLAEVEAQRCGLGVANLTRANLVQAKLDGGTLTEANLSDANLRSASLVDARALQADLRGASLKSLRGYEKARWIGADIREIDFTGAWLCRRHVMDENYLDEFRNRNAVTRRLYTLWWLTSDCGRSLTRWGLWTGALMAFFSLVYLFVGMDYGAHETWLSPIYYSVVTLTTLGYGDVLPATAPAQFVAMCEVTIGYVLLGGLLSIFSDKMARRAE